ncbi:LytR C-terminal domain-containing protein [Candidatus Daviesbacteria bacterium]|nr:LytR C-terminal domain-containing protein [Candidatus Daviesbacteria bacterium]
MFSFNKNPALIYIQKNALDIYIGGEEKHLEFPPDTVSDSDILDLEKYQKLIEDFILSEKIKKQKAILVLSGEIVYQKVVPLIDKKILDERMADFASMIPIEHEKLFKKSIEIEDNIQLFAVNKNLFEKIIEILEKLKFEVLAVVPLHVYSSDNSIDQDLIKKVYSDQKLLKSSNFISGSFSPEDNSQNNKNLVVMISLSVIIFVLGFTLVSIYFKLPIPFLNKAARLEKIVLKNLPSTGTESAELKSSTESAESKISTSSAVLDKDQLKVMVLNGTGIVGQAGKIKELLVKMGFTKIETDNAEGAKADNTIVVFSAAVGEDLREEVVDLLDENFDSVSTQDNADSDSADILITTGKPKAAP